MILVLPYPPSANAYWRVVKGRPIVSREARAYKTKVALLARKELGPMAEPKRGPLHITVSVYRPRKVGDLDNTLKVLLDSLRGIAFLDDSQIIAIDARRADDAANPRAVVTVDRWTQ